MEPLFVRVIHVSSPNVVPSDLELVLIQTLMASKIKLYTIAL